MVTLKAGTGDTGLSKAESVCHHSANRVTLVTACSLFLMTLWSAVVDYTQKESSQTVQTRWRSVYTAIWAWQQNMTLSWALQTQMNWAHRCRPAQCGPVVLAFCVCLNDLIFSKQRAATVGPSHTVIVRHGLPSTRFLRGCGSCMLEVWVTSWSVGELATSKVGLWQQKTDFCFSQGG